MLRILSLKKQRSHYEKFIGLHRPVLVESSDYDGVHYGYTPEYVRVAVNSPDVSSNSSENIYLDSINPDGFINGKATNI